MLDTLNTRLWQLFYLAKEEGLLHNNIAMINSQDSWHGKYQSLQIFQMWIELIKVTSLKQKQISECASTGKTKKEDMCLKYHFPQIKNEESCEIIYCL